MSSVYTILDLGPTDESELIREKVFKLSENCYVHFKSIINSVIILVFIFNFLP